tara:strand:- start:912 stop:1484 length:573 start_codon:yes stop_codon:yes gene_type:complete
MLVKDFYEVFPFTRFNRAFVHEKDVPITVIGVILGDFTFHVSEDVWVLFTETGAYVDEENLFLGTLIVCHDDIAVFGAEGDTLFGVDFFIFIFEIGGFTNVDAHTSVRIDAKVPFITFNSCVDVVDVMVQFAFPIFPEATEGFTLKIWHVHHTPFQHELVQGVGVTVREEEVFKVVVFVRHFYIINEGYF